MNFLKELAAQHNAVCKQRDEAIKLLRIIGKAVEEGDPQTMADVVVHEIYPFLERN